METKKFIFFCGIIISFVGCSTGNCRSQQIKAEQAAGETGLKENKLLPDPTVSERVKVFKANGSLQCGQGKTIPPNVMAKELKEIPVYKSTTENDGKLRIQVCGAATGNVNIFEIDKTNLERALDFGFAEWIQ